MGLRERIRKAQGEVAGESTPIDLDLAAEEAEEAPKAAGKPIWGRPMRCPECGGRGYLDQIDLRRRVMYQHCVECSHKWVTAESETVSAP